MGGRGWAVEGYEDNLRAAVFLLGELEVQVRQQEAMARLGQLALMSRDLPTLLAEATTIVAEAVEADVCEVLESEPGSRRLVVRAGVGLQPGVVGTVVRVSTNGGGGRGAHDQAAAVVECEVDRHAGPSYLRTHGVVCGLSAVVRGFGLLRVWSTTARTFSASDLWFLGAASNTLSLAYERSATDGERARLAAIVESSSDAVISTAVDGTILTWNAAAEHLYGVTAAHMRGKRIARLFPVESRSKIHAVLSEVAHGQFVEPIETVYGRADGRSVAVEVSFAAVIGAGDEVTGISAIARDVSARRQAEAARAKLEGQLLQSQKLEAIGRLAGGISHDFRNLLTVMNGYADLAVRRVELDEHTRHQVEEIRRAGRRAVALTGQLLAFSKEQTVQPRSLDMNGIVRGIEPMLRRLIGEDVELDIRSATDPARVYIDEAQLENAIVNLAINARDAMPEGGRLSIDISQAYVDASDLPSDSATAEGAAYVIVTVADTGHGMDDTVQQHIFEPFFTTKEPGRGTGLGLATTYGVVNQAGGFVLVESGVGEGTTVKVCLPRANEPEEPPMEQPAIIQPSGGTETILVVEDDDSLRSFVCDALADYGYRVLDAKEGIEAMALAAAYPGPIDLLLTDLVMPGMRGTILATGLLAHRPGLHVLCMSAYIEQVLRSEQQSVAWRYIEKPFTPEELAAKVREAIDSPPPSMREVPGRRAGRVRVARQGPIDLAAQSIRLGEPGESAAPMPRR